MLHTLIATLLMGALPGGVSSGGTGAEPAPTPDPAAVRAFELASGDVRLRVDGGAPFGAALVRVGRGARSAVLPLVLDESGGGALDWPRSIAVAFAGASLSAAIATPAGPALAHGAMVSFEAAAAQRGDVVVTEFMKNPAGVSDSSGEWIEILNVAPGPRQIAGWMLHDGGSNSHVIQPNGPFIVLFPGDRLVLGNEADPTLNGGVQVDYVWSSFSLSNGADEIFLTGRNGMLVDEVVYDDTAWPDDAGQSASLKPGAEDAFLNDDPTNWCSATSVLASGDSGTPGAPNDTCP